MKTENDCLKTTKIITGLDKYYQQIPKLVGASLRSNELFMQSQGKSL